MRLCLHNTGQQQEVGKQRQLEGECARPVTLGAAHRALCVWRQMPRQARPYPPCRLSN